MLNSFLNICNFPHINTDITFGCKSSTLNMRPTLPSAAKMVNAPKTGFFFFFFLVAILQTSYLYLSNVSDQNVMWILYSLVACIGKDINQFESSETQSQPGHTPADHQTCPFIIIHFVWTAYTITHYLWLWQSHTLLLILHTLHLSITQWCLHFFNGYIIFNTLKGVKYYIYMYSG